MLRIPFSQRTWLDEILQKSAGNIEDFGGSPYVRKSQETAFEKLLLAFYGRPYTIEFFVEFHTMVQMAEDYCALPALSASLSGALFHSPKFRSNIGHFSTKLLGLAIKLRHEVLFRECLVHVLGPWKKPRYKAIFNPNLYNIAQAAYNKMCADLVSCQQEISHIICEWPPNEVTRQTWEILKLTDQGDGISMPAYYAALQKSLDILCYGKSFPTLERLLSNNLVLDPFGETGVDNYTDFFLCGTDVELPWNQTESDW